jgi:hypothetical protein
MAIDVTGTVAIAGVPQDCIADRESRPLAIVARDAHATEHSAKGSNDIAEMRFVSAMMADKIQRCCRVAHKRKG